MVVSELLPLLVTTIAGRSKLPRSMRNLFTRVVFAAHTEKDIRLIVERMATSEVDSGTISVEHLRSVLKMHFEINNKLQIKEIGSLGSMQPFNLRDIFKFMVQNWPYSLELCN